MNFLIFIFILFYFIIIIIFWRNPNGLKIKHKNNSTIEEKKNPTEEEIWRKVIPDLGKLETLDGFLMVVRGELMGVAVLVVVVGDTSETPSGRVRIS